MPMTRHTHAANWREVLRAQEVFVAVVDDETLQDARFLRQLAYARELGMPIYLLLQEGVALPKMYEGEHLLPWATTEELAQLVADIEEGKR